MQLQICKHFNRLSTQLLCKRILLLSWGYILNLVTIYILDDKILIHLSIITSICVLEKDLCHLLMYQVHNLDYQDNP